MNADLDTQLWTQLMFNKPSWMCVYQEACYLIWRTQPVWIFNVRHENRHVDLVTLNQIIMMQEVFEEFIPSISK